MVNLHGAHAISLDIEASISRKHTSSLSSLQFSMKSLLNQDVFSNNFKLSTSTFRDIAHPYRLFFIQIIFLILKMQ